MKNNKSKSIGVVMYLQDSKYSNDANENKKPYKKDQPNNNNKKPNKSKKEQPKKKEDK